MSPLTAPSVPSALPCNASTAANRAAVVIDERLRIPPQVHDLEAFRRWTHSEAFPEHIRVAFLDGSIWVDLSMEQAFSHNDVKHEVAAVLRALVRVAQTGRYFGDGMRLSHHEANLSTDPDGLFVSYESVQNGRIHQVAGQRGGVVEFVGTPEMVLEVVSDTSVEKDTVELPRLYQRAGVREFWRIDVRGEVVFEILQRQPDGWTPTRQSDGWWRSPVFAHDFRLIQAVDPLGQPQYTLETRPTG